MPPIRVPLLLSLTLFVAACSDSSSPDDDPTPAPSTTDVTIVGDASSKGDQAYSPANFTLSLASDATVEWFNNDQGGGGTYGSGSGTTHTVTSDDGTTFSSGNVAPGSSFSHTFTAAGTYTYHCTIHTSMTGTVTVNP